MSLLLSWFAPTKRPQNPRGVRLVVEHLEDRSVPTLLGQQLFPADNPWNQRITNAPVASNSAAIMSNFTGSSDGLLHPDFSQDFHDARDLYGIPFNVVQGNKVAKVSVVIEAYSDESDILAAPIPAGAVIEGDFQNGPRAGLDNRGDSHLLIFDVDNDIAYEFGRASRPAENADGKWHADQESVWDMKTNSFRTLGWTSADAAGLSILAGLVRPDEALPTGQGGQGVINHAIRFTLRNAVVLDKYIYPAAHHANPGNTNLDNQPPMGARFRLKASVDISQLNPQSKIIAQAMKDYGMIVADNGSNFFFSGASYSVNASNQVTLTWNDNDIQDSTHGLKSLHFSDFEVVDLTPAITNLSTHQGPAGTSVTITGRNFSGAAGHVQVFFGGAVATSVTYVDDSHVVAIAPAGSGTVDVRVQSGVTVPNSTYNLRTPIFGYGSSANTAADDFTYGAAGNQAPRVATPASASPSPIRGRMTTLRVLGVDDGGEAGLIYTWAVTARPTGAADPTFSLNGTNAAKNTVATFTRAGAYSFRVTIADAQGLTVVSTVDVTVQQALTRITVTPATADVAAWSQTQFTATAYDQFDAVVVNPPNFTWRLTGRGILTSRGLFYAPSRAGGPYAITASYGSIRGSATVRVL